jgi:O-antigen ligase
VRRITLALVWLFVLSVVPLGIVSTSSGVGTFSRLIGIVAIGAGVLTTLAERRIRRPGVIFWFALVFAVASVMSLFWTVSYADTVSRAGTYLQFVALIWVVREFARTREQQHSLLLAFCLGAVVFAFDLLRNFGGGVHLERYTANGTNPNYVGVALVTGFPMAWYLLLNHRGVIRVVTALYCFVAPIAVLLTAGRGAFIAGIATLSIVPLTLRRKSFPLLPAIALMCATAVAIGLVVPQQSWDRLFTIKQEIGGGTMNGRVPIWNVGWQLFQQRPFLGVGAGAFPAAFESVRYGNSAAHNLALALLVEQGVVGLSLFAALVGACFWVISGLPSADRKLWAVLMMGWLISGLSGDSHMDKITWVLFGMLAAQDRVKTPHQASAPTLGRARRAVGGTLLGPVPVRRATPISASR